MVIAVEATRQYTVPKYGKSGPALLLAIAMHILLALFLYFGISWQSHAPEAIEAEMWSTLPQIAAPKQSTPEPSPQPVPVREQPVQVVPPPEPPPLKPDIVIKDPVKKPDLKPAPPPPPPAPPPPKVEPKPAPPPVKAAPPAPATPSQRNFDFDPVKPSTGTAAVTSGPQGSPGYANKISAWVRPHVHSTAEGNLEVVVTIQLLPSGEVRDVKLKTSSGDPSFDDQVIRGVYASSPLPKDVDGKVVSPLELQIYNKQ